MDFEQISLLARYIIGFNSSMAYILKRIRLDMVPWPHPFALVVSKVSETILTAEKISKDRKKNTEAVSNQKTPEKLSKKSGFMLVIQNVIPVNKVIKISRNPLASYFTTELLGFFFECELFFRALGFLQRLPNCSLESLCKIYSFGKTF